MKVDRALKEVWQWKEEVYEETKDMTFEQHREYDRKILDEIEKKYNIHLRRKSS